MSDIKFMKLGVKERALLLKALNIKIDRLYCQFCKKRMSYKTCCIMPAVGRKKIASIVCDSPLCIAEYFTKEEEKQYEKV